MAPVSAPAASPKAPATAPAPPSASLAPVAAAPLEVPAAAPAPVSPSAPLVYCLISSLGVLVFLAAKSGLIKDTREAAEFQNFIICVEMLIAAVGHLYAFPYKEYAGGSIGSNGGLTSSLVHALKLNDLYHDTVHQFAPTYHEYVLYNPSEGDTGRSNKDMPGTKLEDIQLSDLSSSGLTNNTLKAGTVNSSSLIDTSVTVSIPDDLTVIDIDMSSHPTRVPAAIEAGRR